MTTSSDLEAGRTAGFNDLIAPHWDVLVRVAGRLAPPGSRDDVLQDALTLAWRRRASYDPGRGSVRAWLLVITADQARRRWRRRRVWHPVGDRRLVWDWLGSNLTDGEGYGQFPTVTVY
ncbi:MAG: sigma factor [Jatrophihabitantaceae bacterium]